jgi:hypothetical protein
VRHRKKPKTYWQEFVDSKFGGRADASGSESESDSESESESELEEPEEQARSPYPKRDKRKPMLFSEEYARAKPGGAASNPYQLHKAAQPWTSARATGGKALSGRVGDQGSTSDSENEFTHGPRVPAVHNCFSKNNETLQEVRIDETKDWKSIGGMEDKVREVKECILFPLLYTNLFTHMGTVPPSGILFHGPPGTGKTLLVRALAGSCRKANLPVTLFLRKGADILSKWIGEGERQLRLLFEEAKRRQPSIIFFRRDRRSCATSLCKE